MFAGMIGFPKGNGLFITFNLNLSIVLVIYAPFWQQKGAQKLPKF